MYYIYEIYSVAGWLALVVFLSYWGVVSVVRRNRQRDSLESVRASTEANDKQH
jgi:hypothetical protein